MKQPLLAFGLLLVAACAKSPITPTGAISRDLIDTSSTNRQLKNESQDLSGAIDAIGIKSRQVGELCDDLSERVSAFNEVLAARQTNLGVLMKQKDDIKNLLRPVREQYRQAIEDEGKSKGVMAANNRLISYYSRPASVKDFIRVDKKQLGKDREFQERNLRKALRAENEAEYPSGAFDRAEADELAARRALTSIKAQLNAMTTAAQAQVNTNAQILRDANTAEDVKLKDAQSRKSSAETGIGVYKGQLRAKVREIAQLSKLENLSPLDVPVVCQAP